MNMQSEALSPPIQGYSIVSGFDVDEIERLISTMAEEGGYRLWGPLNVAVIDGRPFYSQVVIDLAGATSPSKPSLE